MKRVVLYIFSAVLLFTSCTNVKKLERSYQLFQTGLDSISNYSYKSLVLKPDDIVSIKAYTAATTSQEQAALFNLLGGKYVISKDGNLELPKIGTFKTVGLTCNQLKEFLSAEWGKYVKDIIVDVQMNGFSVNVLGEVGSQGVKIFNSEKATIIDALAMSGGLNVDGKRNDILVIREENGKRQSYFIDLRDTKFYQSPAFQLQQNDLIYVGADMRKFKAMSGAEFRNNIMPITQAVSISISLINLLLLIGRR